MAKPRAKVIKRDRSKTDTPSVTYTYNPAGRLITLSSQYSPSGLSLTTYPLTRSYTYDELGRLASETTELPGFDKLGVGYRYDKLGRRQKLIYPDGSKVRYAYDARNRLTSLDDDSKGQPLAGYTYDSLGRIAGLTRDNGVATRYRYDMAGQLTDIAHTQGGQALVSSHYDLDTLGRRTAQTREDNTTESYRYDATSQLTGVDYGPGKTETFAYDPVGNRTEATALISVNREPRTVNFSYTTNALNQYTLLTPGASAPVSFAYDTNGNLINDGRFDYVYDSQNRLVSVTSVQPLVPSVTQNPTPIRAEFTYDARNRCVLRKYYTLGSQGQWVLNEADSRALTYDSAWNLLAERTLSGQKVGAYLHGQRTDEILRAELKPYNLPLTTSYPLADGLGSTVALTNAKGKVTDRYRYSAYGTPTVLTATYQLKTDSGSSYRFLFTGREWLSFVQLNDHRYRYYSPGLGRWLTTDPIGFKAKDVNLYRYVKNQVTESIDPFGFYASSNCKCKGGEAIEQVLAVGPLDALTANGLAIDARSEAQNSGLAGLTDGQADAFRHCFWSCRMAQEIGADQAKSVGDTHEACGGGSAGSTAMDLANNATGRGFGTPGADCNQSCMGGVQNGGLQTTP